MDILDWKWDLTVVPVIQIKIHLLSIRHKATFILSILLG